MRIGLLSDTHSYIDPHWAKYFETCDEIWHAGDFGNIEVLDYLKKLKKVRAVYGNIDGKEIRSEIPEILNFSINGVKVLMIHIGGYPGKYDKLAKQLIEEHHPTLFICGHSHILRVIYDTKYKMLTMNPGAAGLHGFHKIKTLIRFTLLDSKISDAEIIELGPKRI